MAQRRSKSINISLGLVLGVMVCLYLGYHMISYVTNDSLSVYKVKEVTSLDSNDSFTGLILREETVVNSEDSGYINYYIASGSKCAVDDIAYSIDENGTFNNALSSNNGTSGLSTENLLTMTNMLSNYSASYSGVKFDSAYTLRSNIDNTLVGFLNIDDEESLKQLGIDTRFFKAYKSTSSGLIEYYTDGFEGTSADDISAASFDQSLYNKTMKKTGEKISSGDAAYKLITNEKWSIIIKLDDEFSEKYSGKDRLPIEFSEYGLKTTALFEQFTGSDGAKYGKLTLSKYMIQFAESRYLTVNIINSTKTGLKIPKSAITTKEFFKIPVSYLTQGGNSNMDGFNVETISTSGTTVTFKSPTISYRDDEYVYIAKDQIDIGSVLIKPDSDEKIAVSQTGELSGVYQVNQGFAVFKIISIIDEDADYAISEQNSTYSVNVYDMIMLEASSINEGDKIY